MGQERRIFGPPGTGKTELLASTIIPQAVDNFGSNKVLVCSLTKTGARTIASRAKDIDQNNVGTIHKICYRALGSPKLVVEKMSEWNEEHKAMQIGGGNNAFALDEGGGSEGSSSEATGECSNDGEKILSKMNILRSKMVPESSWPDEIKSFKKIWDDFKEQTGTYDFTDLIEVAIKEVPVAPGNPNVLIVDEAQDTNPLQLKLLRSWSSTMDWHILVGDDDQTIYEFAGCTPEAFLNPPLDDKYKRVLSQSYRVPDAVHKLAQYIIKRVSFREKKTYFPRKDSDGNIVKGHVAAINSSYKNTDEVLEAICRKISEGKTVMYLAPCAYMLDGLKQKLVEYGIPFENEFRRRRSDWNPLYDDRKGISTKRILKNFLDCGEDDQYWTVEQFVTWAKYLTVGDYGLIKKVGKKAIEALEKAIENNQPGLYSTRNVVGKILGPEAVSRALERNTDWLALNLQKQRINAIKYPMKVIQNFGKDAIDQKPKLTIGTIHSVKGGEADCVFLCPDLSKQAYASSLIDIQANDSLCRLFYVAVTRSRDEVYVMRNATKCFFNF